MTDTPMASILIVEDDAKQLKLYAKALRGYRLTCVSNATEAMTVLSSLRPDLILLDNILAEGERGVGFIPRLKNLAAHVPIIVISGTLNMREKLNALQGPRSAHYVLEKPVDLDELDRTIEIALTECGIGETVRALRSLEQAEKTDGLEPERRFTERLARQHEMLCRLRGTTERPNISQLSRDYNVARKTIIRDLQDLIKRGQLADTIYSEWNPDGVEPA